MTDLRRYDMVHDSNATTGTYQWKMQRTNEGQYVPFIDVEQLITENERLEIMAAEGAERLERIKKERDEYGKRGEEMLKRCAELAAALEECRRISFNFVEAASLQQVQSHQQAFALFGEIYQHCDSAIATTGRNVTT